MRRTLSLACCALALVFGFAAGKAHVHGLADHHGESRGLHVAHTHLGHVDRHEADDDLNLDGRLPGHHDDDALYLSVMTRRSLHPGLHAVSADFARVEILEMQVAVSLLVERAEEPSREPPAARPARPRAPPA